jgi:hypothetical protein
MYFYYPDGPIFINWIVDYLGWVVVVLIKFDIGTYARLESKLEFGVDCVRDSSGISLYLNETIVVVNGGNIAIARPLLSRFF